MEIVVIPKSGYEQGKKEGAKVQGPIPLDFEAYQRQLIDGVKWRHERGAFCYLPRGKTLDEVITRIRKMTLPECYERAAWLHETRMANFPSDLTNLRELKCWDQFEDDYQKGFIESSGLRYEEYCWHRNQLAVNALVQGFTNVDSPWTSCCSEILFLRTAEGPLFCRSYDDAVPADVEKTPKGSVLKKYSPQITVYEGGEGYARLGLVNEKALFIWAGGGGVYEYETFPEPQFYAPAKEFLQRYCATVDEGVDLYRRYAIFLGQPNQGVIANLVDSEAVGFDHSKRQVGFFEPNEQGVIFNTSGAATDPELRALCDPENPLFKKYDRRMEFMWKTVEAAGDDLDEEVMWRGVLDHDSNWCNHYESLPRGFALWSCGCLLFKLAKGEQQSRMTYWDGSRFVHPCQMESIYTTFPVFHPGGMFIGRPSEYGKRP